MYNINFSAEDIAQMRSMGIDREEVVKQIINFKTGFPAIVLDSPATIDNGGIFRLSTEEEDFYIHYFDEHSVNKKIYKFVPASGAATRMFKDLYTFSSLYDGTSQKNIEKDFPTVKEFLDNLQHFAFYDDLLATMKSMGMDIDEYMQRGDYTSIINCLLGKPMGYGNLAKGLIKFHRYSDGARTAMSEHLTEAYRYAHDKDGWPTVHFTVPYKQRTAFGKEAFKLRKYFEDTIGAKFHIKFTEQQHSTDIIAVDEYNEPVRDDNGRLVFRPGGHGALLSNLSYHHADLVFIKNIDNVIPDDPRVANHQSTTVRYKKLLGGMLLYLQKEIFSMVELLKTRIPTDEELMHIEDFMSNRLCIDISRAKAAPQKEKLRMLLGKLNRPLRVCGMVKNQGEPGGGPFWVVNGDGTKSLQIVESSQINRKNSSQEAILQQSTHFNPVDLACSYKSYNGRHFALQNYVDPTTGFISKKSVGAKVVKSQELPGLWNGSMANWTTVFVEVPLETFNPVKTVNDLLRKEHLMQ